MSEYMTKSEAKSSVIRSKILCFQTMAKFDVVSLLLYSVLFVFSHHWCILLPVMGWLQNMIQLLDIIRDQPNSRFHGRDIFREIGLLQQKTPISMFPWFFSWILTLLLSFMKVFRVLSTAFVCNLLFATCHTSALSSWHVFTVLLTYIQSWVLT